MLTQYKLKNKLKVLLVESHKAPVVAVQMWVKTGSADEKKGQEGISHFIEHLVFKGTRKFGVGEVARTVEASGGELNAYTTFDHTVFHVTMSRDDIEVGLDCIAEMMGFPLFDPEEIDKEREVVVEEIKRSFDNPHAISSQQLFKTLFNKHPYGIPVIGYADNIKTVSPKVLLKYYHSRYVPSNMTLVVAGDFEKARLKRLIDKYYGSFKSYPLRKAKRVTEPKQKTIRAAYLASDFQEASMNISFRAPNARHPDVPAIDVFAMVIGQGDSSRLVRRLRLEQPLVTSVSAGSFNPLDDGLFAFSAHFKAEKTDEVHQIMLNEIERALTEPISSEELDRARLNLEAEEIFSLETVDGLARKVGIFQTLANDPNYIQKYMAKIQKLTAAEILKTVRKYLKPSNAVMTMMIHKNDQKLVSKKKFDAMVEETAAMFERAAKVKPKIPKEKSAKRNKLGSPLRLTKSESKIEKHKLSDGTLVVLKRNPEVPIFHIKVGFLGGLRLETEQSLGVTTLLSNTWTSGSQKYTEHQIAELIESCAGSVSAFGGRNSVGLTVESLTSHEEQALDVFADVLKHPVFPADAVTREAKVQMEYLRTRDDHPSSVAAQLFMENIFAGHPYARDLLGSTETLGKMSTPDVRDHWKKMVTAGNGVFVAIGDFKTDRMLKYLEGLSKSLKPGKRLEQNFELEPMHEDKFAFRKSEKEQTNIIVGYRGLPYIDEDRYGIEILEAILAGQGGRLFYELRDKASLAYSVSPINMRGMETGYFGVYIGCSPEKGKTAIGMIHQELNKMLLDPPSEIEVLRAKRYLIGRNHIDLQRNGAQASSILFDELYGVDCEETFRFAEHLRSITPDDIQRIAHRVLKGGAMTVAVGPVQPWD